MKIDINTLAEHFAKTSFQVVVVYRGIREPGAKAKDYTDPYPGFVFPLSGKAKFIFEGTPYHLTPGTVVHGGAQMELDRCVLGDTRWEYLLVLYRIIGPEPEGFSLLTSHFELPTGQSPRLNELLERLRQVSSQPGGIPAFQTETLFRNVLEEMFLSVRSRTKGEAQGLYEQIAAYIHEHYMEPLSMPVLAEQYGINKNRLAYLFYKYALMGPGDYLLKYRLNRAKILLMTSGMPVRQIAQAVGFNDPFYFSKAFKKQFRLSPSEFRDKFINNT